MWDTEKNLLASYFDMQVKNAIIDVDEKLQSSKKFYVSFMLRVSRVK